MGYTFEFYLLELCVISVSVWSLAPNERDKMLALAPLKPNWPHLRAKGSPTQPTPPGKVSAVAKPPRIDLLFKCEKILFIKAFRNGLSTLARSLS